MAKPGACCQSVKQAFGIVSPVAPIDRQCAKAPVGAGAFAAATTPWLGNARGPNKEGRISTRGRSRASVSQHESARLVRWLIGAADFAVQAVLRARRAGV